MSDDHSPRPQTAHPLDPADVQAISDWLVEQGLYTAGFETLFAGFCERLIAAGVPLWRGQVAMRTLASHRRRHRLSMAPGERRGKRQPAL
jgi:adenylate cyclase